MLRPPPLMLKTMCPIIVNSEHWVLHSLVNIEMSAIAPRLVIFQTLCNSPRTIQGPIVDHHNTNVQEWLTDCYSNLLSAPHESPAADPEAQNVNEWYDTCYTNMLSTPIHAAASGHFETLRIQHTSQQLCPTAIHGS